jgi:hypothetical protein
MKNIKRELQHNKGYDFSDSLKIRKNFIFLLEGRIFIGRLSYRLEKTHGGRKVRQCTGEQHFPLTRKSYE